MYLLSRELLRTIYTHGQFSTLICPHTGIEVVIGTRMWHKFDVVANVAMANKLHVCMFYFNTRKLEGYISHIASQPGHYNDITLCTGHYNDIAWEGNSLIYPLICRRL